MFNSFMEQSDLLREQGEIGYADAIVGLMIQSNTQIFDIIQKEKTQMVTPTLARFILQEEIEEYEAQLAKNERDLAKNKRDLAKKDKEIARLRAKLAEKSQKKRK